MARRLDSLSIPYAVAGGLALFQHGYRRFTEDVNLLVTKDGLDRIHASLDGIGYLAPFPGSKHLRDTDLGVRIEFLVAGDFPGDGKPKPVSFPAPDTAAIEVDGIRYLNLAMLIQLKLASGMTNVNRMKDLTDVIELIKVLALPKSLATQLDPYVRKMFLDLWDQTRSVARRFVRFFRDDLVTADQRQRMLQDGVVIVPEGDHVWLQTTDPEVARRYGMEEDDR